ncbi:MAG: hypothetical protein PSX36_06520 [bacterium]|nr:hypothetical protein [bacterium]
MEGKTDFLSKLLNKKTSNLVVSINDLRDKEFSGIKLNAEERAALANFDKYRLKVLNSQIDDEQFHLKYRQIQVIANLSDWKEFLKENFTN